jgi:hypothetical protein
MPQHQSQHKTTTDSAIEVANASAPHHPLITHAVATSCGVYTCVQDRS